MKDEIVHQLLSLNQDFYAHFAQPFADSRASPQPGFNLLLDHLPEIHGRVLDVGCGNGRFGSFLLSTGETFKYTGIDFTENLLLIAQKNVEGTYLRRDISQVGFLEGVGEFDLIVCLATMQHLPGRRNRIAMLIEMSHHLSKNGRIFLSNWQFLDSPRQRKKIQDWDKLNLVQQEIESGDYLLSWEREGRGLRYVCAIDAQETEQLAEAADLEVLSLFRSDGREGNLNLYAILTHKETSKDDGRRE